MSSHSMCLCMHLFCLHTLRSFILAFPRHTRWIIHFLIFNSMNLKFPPFLRAILRKPKRTHIIHKPHLSFCQLNCRTKNRHQLNPNYQKPSVNPKSKQAEKSSFPNWVVSIKKSVALGFFRHQTLVKGLF